MKRVDRRRKLALDESYQYYKTVEDGELVQNFKLASSFRTVATALAFADSGEIKLTRQLWKRLQQALFDKMVNTCAGTVRVFDLTGYEYEPGKNIPDEGYIQFHPQGCNRTDDTARLELSRIYPKTLEGIRRAWSEGRCVTGPGDFDAISECSSDGICLMKPVVTGHEILSTESQSGKDAAYAKWWKLYWQAVDSADNQQRLVIFKQMTEIEEVWGDLNY